MVLALRSLFWADLRTGSAFALYIINWLVFYNRGGKCLLRCTDWFLI